MPQYAGRAGSAGELRVGRSGLPPPAGAGQGSGSGLSAPSALVVGDDSRAAYGKFQQLLAIFKTKPSV